MTSHHTTVPSPAASPPAAADVKPLRVFLALDAVVTAGNGLVYTVASGPVGDLLGLDSGFLLGVGVFLLAFGAFVGFLASRPVPPAAGTVAVVEANLLWAVASVAAVAFGWLDPNTVGAVWAVLQGVVVAAFGVLQQVGLRRLRGRAGGRRATA